MGAQPKALLPCNLRRVREQPPAEQLVERPVERADALPIPCVAEFCELAAAFALRTGTGDMAVGHRALVCPPPPPEAPEATQPHLGVAAPRVRR